MQIVPKLERHRQGSACARSKAGARLHP
jgi:hypothetical protein